MLCKRSDNAEYWWSPLGVTVMELFIVVGTARAGETILVNGFTVVLVRSAQTAIV